jgi:hypothetical protein
MNISSQLITYEIETPFFSRNEAIGDSEIEPINIDSTCSTLLIISNSCESDSTLELFISDNNTSTSMCLQSSLFDYSLNSVFTIQNLALVGYSTILFTSMNESKDLELFIMAVSTIIVISIVPAIILWTEDQNELIPLKQEVLAIMGRKKFDVFVNGRATGRSFIVEKNRLKIDLKQFSDYLKDEGNKILLENDEIHIIISESE